MDARQRIQAAAERMGYSVDWHRADTGTDYLYCKLDGTQVTVRIADHGECYLPTRPERRINVAPDGVTATRAICMLAAPDSIPVVEATERTEAERRVDRQIAERQSAEAATLAERVAQIRAMLTDADRAEFARCPNRVGARRIAERLNVSVAAAWTALTGKKWNR